ncbi:M48 family metallopeptidase [Nereida sp. MMG024]|nr:M48 family metallopeptidase [Nereida sp. MMG025]
MTEIVLQGEPTVTVQMRRSAAARRMSLRVSSLDGRVSLTVPKRGSEREALAFLHSKEMWLRKHLARQAPMINVDHGVEVPIGGQMYEVVQATKRGVHIEDRQLRVGGAANAGAKVQAYLKAQARLILHREADQFSQKLGKPYGKLTLRDTRSRWGSCSSSGNLNFSWRLIMAPPKVLSYVAAHEVAHLAQMNHSDRFWGVCRDLFGAYEEERTWLRVHGASLHQYRFKD